MKREYILPIDPEDGFVWLMTVNDFEKSVEIGALFSDWGCGYWVKDNKESRDEVFSTKKEDATHVSWYNK